MPRLTFAGQIDHPASLKLERAEEKSKVRPCLSIDALKGLNTQTLIAQAMSVLREMPPQEIQAHVDLVNNMQSLKTPEPSPREALREGDLVMCNPARTKEWHPARVTKLGERYIQAQYASDRTSAWDKDHWRFPTSAELSEHAAFLLSQEPKCPN